MSATARVQWQIWVAKMKKDEIVDLIERAFHGTPMPTPENLVQMGADAVTEDPGTDQQFAASKLMNRHWEDFTATDVRQVSDALSIMTPEAIRYYLPAYMIAVIKDPSSADFAIDTTKWNLSPPPFGYSSLEAFEKRISVLSPGQRTAIAYFFEYLRRQPQYGVTGDKPTDRVTCYWLRYYPTPLSDEVQALVRGVEPVRATPTFVDEQSTIEEIEEAFRDVPRPSSKQLTRPGVKMSLPGTWQGPEGVTYRLQGRRWGSLTPDDVIALDGALPMLTPEAFQYYLPSFLTLLLKSPHTIGSSALKSTVWAVSPPPFGTSSIEDFEERIGLLTVPQGWAINTFVEYLRETEFYLSQFLGDENYQHLTFFWSSFHLRKA